jgi:hypothetical protein
MINTHIVIVLKDPVDLLTRQPGQARHLRKYRIQLDQPRPGLSPGRGPVEAHDREHLGVGGRRVLVSRD